MWCEPSRRCHFLLADWISVKTMVYATMRLRQTCSCYVDAANAKTLVQVLQDQINNGTCIFSDEA